MKRSKLLSRLKAWHDKQCASGIWYCKNPYCRCCNTVQKKFYIKSPKCPKCGKRMKKE